MDSLSVKTASVGRISLKSFGESLRSKLLFKFIDAAIIAHLRPKQPFRKQIEMIVNPRTSNLDRVGSAVNLLNLIKPDASIRVSRFLCSYEHLPFQINSIRLMAYGSGSSVFLLETDAGHKVMKVYRRSLGRTGEGLLELCHEFKNKFEIVSSIYNGRYRFVSPALFLILHGPALAAPAAALVQSYIPGEKKDLFIDFTNEELVAFLQHETCLKERFIFFAQKTLEVYNHHGLCFDFIGRENLMMVKHEGQYQLFIIDYGIFNLEKLRIDSPAQYFHINAHIDRLTTILTILGEGIQ